MPDASAVTERFPFTTFLSVLRAKGFSVDASHYSRLLELVESRDFQEHPHRLRSLLCPLFASTPGQQNQFYVLYDEFFPSFSPRRSTIVDPPRRLTVHPRTTFWKKPWVVALTGTILPTAALWWWLRPVRVAPQPPAPMANATSKQEKSSSDYPEPPLPPLEVSSPTLTVDARPIIEGLFLFGLPILYFAYELWFFARRREILSRSEQRFPPVSWPKHAATFCWLAGHPTPIRQIARLLRRRRSANSQMVDVGRTVSATIRALGFPEFEYLAATARPEYLFLVDRQSPRDHLAVLFAQIAEALEHEGVIATTLFYIDDPSICWDGEGESISLSDLKARFHTSRLFVFGDGRQWINPLNGELTPAARTLSEWPGCVLFTPSAGLERSVRERALAHVFRVLPASLEGLLQLVHEEPPPRSLLAAESGGRGLEWREPRDATAAAAFADELEAHLGPSLFLWASACALHHELHWDLTWALGRHIAPSEEWQSGGEQLLIRMLRLPWFRRGAIPTLMRDVLVRRLDPRMAAEARAVVVKFLRQHLPPAGSFAEQSNRLEVAAHEWSLFPLEHEGIRQDEAALRLFESARPPRKGWLEFLRRLFRFRVPSLGFKNWVRIAFTFASLVMMGFGVRTATPIRQMDLVLSLPLPVKLRAEAYLKRGDIYFDRADWERAIANYSVAIGLSPTADAYRKRGAALGNRDPNDWKRGLADYQNSLRLDPRLALTHYDLGIVYSERGDGRAAMDEFNRAIELDPRDGSPHTQLGVIYQELGNFTRAMEEYDRAIALKGHSARFTASTYVGRGYLRDELHEDDLALADFREAIKVYPFDVVSYNNFASVCRRQGKFKEAIDKLAEGLERLPRSARLHRIQGYNYLAAKDIDKAEAAFRTAVRWNPYDYFALDELGNIYSDKEDWDTAIRHFTAALEKLPGYHPARFNRGLAYKKKGDKDKAIADFQAIVSDPERDDLKDRAATMLSELK